jgi:hypothetical protein
MSYTINARAFFFNAKTDYLPYYKNFTLTLTEDATAKAILEAIQAQNEDFSFPQLNLVFRINDLVVEEETPLASIIARLGTNLKIDPVTSYRSNNGLIINNHDFMQSFDLLAPYATSSDKKYYKTLYALHYASETSNFDRDYIGDAVLVLAHKMISEGNEDKESILNAITTPYSGLLDCEYENNLFNTQSYAAAITALKEMVKDNSSEHPSLLDMIKSRFFNTKEEAKNSKPKTQRNTIEIKDIEAKQVAYYAGNSKNTDVLEQISNRGMASVNFSRTHKLSGVTLIEDNKNLAFKKAGATLLDAFDAGAEVLIVEDEASYMMFKKYFKAIENTIGRKIIGLELISSKDFMTQTNIISA